MLLNRNSSKRWSASALMLLLLNAVGASAQSSTSRPNNAAVQDRVTVTEAFLKEAEKAIADLERLRAVSAAQAEALTAKDAQIAALRSLLDVQRQISEDWKAAAMQRKDALATTDKLIATYDARILQLEKDLGAARRSRNRWAVVGVVVGAALGLFAAK